MKILRLFTMIAILFGVLSISPGFDRFPHETVTAARLSASVSPSTSPEGNDFATQVLKDAWDMNQIKDISRYLNTSGVLVNLSNINVANGVFSARSVNDQAQFDPLFPGYLLGYNPGNYGINYPINSSKYRCFSMRAKIDSPGADEIRVFWFQDRNLGAVDFGVSKIINVVQNTWAIYNVDLSTSFDNINSKLSWTSRPSWQGLRIDPTRRAGVNFAVDWVRLTDCVGKNATFSWTPFNATGELWMGRSPNSQETLLNNAINANTSSISINVSGWEAGDYYFGIRNTSNNNFQWSSMKILAAPKIIIQKPSYTSGEGMLWNMDSAQELDFGGERTKCVDTQFSNSILNLTTAPPASIGSNCRASGYSDPQLSLKMPVSPFVPAEYRYLTYQLNTVGNWQDINKGWVFRWLWYYHTSGQLCIGVTYGISIDVGWERYALDMHNPSIGTPNYTELCAAQPWAVNPIDYLRFDPNENDTTAAIVQQLDWISLNKMDRVQKGALFPVTISSSQPVGNLSLSFFYTTTPSQPTANAMVIVNPSPPGPSGSRRIYLPAVLNGIATLANDGIIYYWNTSSVQPGIYYVCVRSQDQAGNISTDCSEAPVQVY